MVLLLSCTAAVPLPTVGRVPRPRGTGAHLAEDAAAEVVEGSESPEVPEEDAGPFGLDHVATIAFTWDDAAQRSLERDGEVDVHADVQIDGETLRDVAVHIKGNLGSERTIDQKAALKVDFNQFVPGRRWRDLEALTLNNMVNDPSYVHEVIAYEVYAAMGIPVPRAGYAWVTVNGEDFGLYLNLETPDDRWLKRVYADPNGNLYEGGHMLVYRNGNHGHADFYQDSDDLYTLDEGQDVGRADVYAVTEALIPTVDLFDHTDGLVDWDKVTDYLAAEVWVGDSDGYAWNSNNFRVYFAPETGRVELLPWGQDATFSSGGSAGMSGALGAACERDEACDALLATAVEAVCVAADGAPLLDRLDTATTLIEALIEADPRKEGSLRQAISGQDDLRTWITERSAALRRQRGDDG